MWEDAEQYYDAKRDADADLYAEYQGDLPPPAWAIPFYRVWWGMRNWWCWRSEWMRRPFRRCPDCERRNLFSTHYNCIPF